MNNIDRITSKNYLPLVDDILRVREPTTAVIEHRYRIYDTDFLFVDVGGQRSERKKWINCFDSITSIMFIASLNDYDLTMTTDELGNPMSNQKSVTTKQNRLKEALDLFRTIINWKKRVYKNDSKNRTVPVVDEELLFKKIGIILFLNKDDLFSLKILNSPLNQCFNDFDDTKYENNQRASVAKKYIADKFIECNEYDIIQNQRNIYYHYTFALDRDSMKVVIANVKQRILEQMMDDFVL
jgi:hypothetical protein